MIQHKTASHSSLKSSEKPLRSVRFADDPMYVILSNSLGKLTSSHQISQGTYGKVSVYTDDFRRPHTIIDYTKLAQLTQIHFLIETQCEALLSVEEAN